MTINTASIAHTASRASPRSVLSDHPFARDLHTALSQRDNKRISSKYLYDALGSKLFEAICALPEYYVTASEMDIYARHARAIALGVGGGQLLVELGSGAGEKVKELLPHLRPCAYAAVDISISALTQATQALRYEFPALSVYAIHQDFSQGLNLPPDLPGAASPVWFFPGSSVGNWAPEDAVALLQSLAVPGAQLLIGIDLIKSPALLNAAYNDALGVTAAFNLNLLQRANRELATQFHLPNFRHVAFYNEQAERIEMHIECVSPQKVEVLGETFQLMPGERIHTENSYKYTVESFGALCERAGWQRKNVWLDAHRCVAVLLLRAV